MSLLAKIYTILYSVSRERQMLGHFGQKWRWVGVFKQFLWKKSKSTGGTFCNGGGVSALKHSLIQKVP